MGAGPEAASVLPTGHQGKDPRGRNARTGHLCVVTDADRRTGHKIFAYAAAFWFAAVINMRCVLDRVMNIVSFARTPSMVLPPGLAPKRYTLDVETRKN